MHPRFYAIRPAGPGATRLRGGGPAAGRRTRSRFLGRDLAWATRLTRLNEGQLRAAEALAFRCPDPADWGTAIDLLTKHRKNFQGGKENLRLDAATKEFFAWLESSTLRDRSKDSLKGKVTRFTSAAGNVFLSDLTPDFIHSVICKRWDTPATRIAILLGMSKFCGWCMAAPRRWMTFNPASNKLVNLEKIKRPEPEIFTPFQVRRILVAARDFKGGKLLRTVTLSLFGGLRPTEAVRLRDSAINPKDGELRVSTDTAKTHRARTVKMEPVLAAWIAHWPKAEKNFDAHRQRKTWVQFLKSCRLGRKWIYDGLRHTAISCYFRQSGSYGLTAEWAGNSENTIKKHYQGRVSSAEAASFWMLFPERKDRQAKQAKVLPMLQQRAA